MMGAFRVANDPVQPNLIDSTLEAIAEAADEAAAKTKRSTQDMQRRLRKTSDGLSHVQAFADSVRYHTRRHPLVALGLAFMLGRMVQRRR
jgi:hypothetical protein